MCGIIGFQGSFEPSALSRGLAAIAHRGPDGSGQYFDPGTSTGLGHVRLSILELSPLGHQPMVDPSGQVVIVFNGEIYNYRALRAELETDGHAFRGSSDTEVLLHMYLRHGLDMLPQLDGMFAFSLFDRRIGDLLLVRDSMGIKPVYVSEGPDGFAFCSEMKGLVRVSSRRHRLDVAAIARYLAYQYCPGNGTPFENVRRLGPGEAMRIRAGRIVQRWRWAPTTAVSGERPIVSPSLAVRELRDCLRQSVHAQLVSDVPVGAFLSGGVDSSAVVAFARELNPDIRCFTIDVEGGDDAGQGGDLPYARQVAEHLGVPLDVIRVSSRTLSRDLESLVYQLDEPIADPSGLNVLYIAQAAHSAGLKVLLAGTGGDDLFTGYRRHRAIAMDGFRQALPAAARSLACALTRGPARKMAWARRVHKWTAIDAPDRVSAVIEMLKWLPGNQVAALFAVEHRRLVNERIDDPLIAELGASGLQDPLEQMLLADQRFFLADHNFLYTDKMSMAAGLEVRVPLVANELVRFSWRLSPKLKRRGGASKWVLKQAVKPLLPAGVIRRSKSGFGAPIRRWIREELRDLSEELLCESSLRDRGLFCPGAVGEFVRRTRRGEVDGAYTVFGLMCVEIWCRRFVDES